MYRNKFKAIKKAQKKKKKVAEFYRHTYKPAEENEELRNKVRQKELGKVETSAENKRNLERHT